MMAVGEETGALDDLFIEVADFYEQEVDYDLKQLADAIEPILIVCMGVMVLILALGVFLPMWELGSAAQGGLMQQGYEMATNSKRLRTAIAKARQSEGDMTANRQSGRHGRQASP